MNETNFCKWGAENLALLRADYEMGLSSKRKIAEKHQVSTVSLWRYAKEGRWEYGKRRDKVMEEVSQASVKRLMAMRADIVEDHALSLSILREEIMESQDISEIKRLSRRLDAILECIQGERLCFGLPSEILQSA